MKTIYKVIVVISLLAPIIFFVFGMSGFSNDVSCSHMYGLANINPNANLDTKNPKCHWNTPNTDCYEAPCGFLQGSLITKCFSCRGIGLIEANYVCDNHITPEEWVLQQNPGCAEWINKTKSK